MVDYLRRFFDTSDFPARWDCGNWDRFHGRLHIFSDLAIFGAYVAIALALFWFWRVKRRELAFPGLLWIFGAFIFSCGTTHLMEAVIFYAPHYRVAGALKLTTAGASWAAVFAVMRVAPRAMELPGLRQLNERLREQLEERRRVEAALARSNQDLAEFTGLVTHDLRNPLGSALFIAELAKESIEAGKRREATEQVAALADALRQMEVSVQELHRHAQVQGAEVEGGAVALQEVLEKVRMNLTERLSATNARLVIHPLPIIRGNRTLLLHLFSNLIDNAVKYRGDAVPWIEVAATEAEQEHLITVTDNGRGIPAEARESIFQPKARAANVGEESGSGLGLAFCRRIVAEHGGSILAQSGEGGGAVFEVRFPKA